jgi:hypothetical protein
MNNAIPKNIKGSFIMLEVQKMVLGMRRILQKKRRFDNRVQPLKARNRLRNAAVDKRHSAAKWTNTELNEMKCKILWQRITFFASLMIVKSPADQYLVVDK